MSTIAVLITDDFEDSEYSEPAEAFRKAGHKLIHIGLKKGETVTGKKQATPVLIDSEVDSVRPEDFDALLIPGGYSPDKLRAHKGPVRFVKLFMEQDKPVFAICHGPQLLISAGKLEGRKATGWKSLTCDIKYAGAEYLDKEVVVDANLVTSRQPSDIPAFVKASLEMLGKSRAKAA